MASTLTIRHPQPSHPRSANDRVVLTAATAADREEIYRLRHDIYARELGQHPINPAGRLTDALDPHNLYLTARCGGTLAAFVSLTPPAAPSYSIDKYVARAALPFAVDAGLYEVRLLTVLPAYRGRNLASLLMYAAFRWVESHGGTHIAAIGRREILDLYLKAGLRPIGLSAQSGAVTYDFLHVTIAELRARTDRYADLLARLEARTDWRLNFPFCQPAPCFHGGAFFTAVGEGFDRLARHRDIINADVLDAWFPPAPAVLATLRDELPWLLRTSPPTACSGLVEAIAAARGVSPLSILPGAGSSDLIFRALRQWLTPRSHALILDPTYGEYAHVLEKVIGCTVDRLTLDRAGGFVVDPDRLETALADRYDFVVLVNPNSPTGRHIPRADLERVLRHAPGSTRVWVDETYVDYAGADQSLERFAATSENTIVCKSMSKVYALSGVRAAYLCAGPHQLEELRAITPPWVVSLPAQVAAVRALASPDYYAARLAETHALRARLADELARRGFSVLPGVANFLLCDLPAGGLDAEEVVRACRERGLFLRNAALMGTRLGPRTLRLAVKDAATNARMIAILAEVLASAAP
jgi:histidinol-phosphate/aromatic aminotransferase/cobyric acid decarboxylase-like protein/GNAT superfamily N-acetyltransferase